MNRYPNKPEQASDGEEFAALCIRLHRELTGLKLTYCMTASDQYKYGDTREGYEFKELKNSHKRLRIEIAEKPSDQWWPSGIYADNTARFIVCGNITNQIWTFWRNNLVAFHRIKSPREVWYGKQRTEDTDFDDATIRSFVLEKHEAETFFRYRFQKNNGGVWSLEWGPLTSIRRIGLDPTIGPWH